MQHKTELVCGIYCNSIGDLVLEGILLGGESVSTYPKQTWFKYATYFILKHILKVLPVLVFKKASI